MGSGSALAESARRRGRPRKLSAEEIDILTGLVRDNPLLSLDDIVWAFRRQTGITLSSPTVGRYLRAAGFERSRPGRAAAGAATFRGEGGTVDTGPASQQYGYTEAHREVGDARRYPCGLTDSEWEQVKHLFDPPGRTGRPERYPRRQMLDACIYVLRSGCSWRMLPKDFPSWQAVYKTFRRWLARGLLETMYDELRQLWRSRQHRAPDPTAAVLDSQSVKTSAQGGPKGYDAGKKVKGRKRHLVVDTLGLLLAVTVTAASVQDRDGAPQAVAQACSKYATIEKLYADSAYAGKCAQRLEHDNDIAVEVVRRPGAFGEWDHPQMPLFAQAGGFVILPKRWVVERTHAWLERERRMVMHHDRSTRNATAWAWLAQSRMLLRRLADHA